MSEAAKLGFTAAYTPAGLKTSGESGLIIHMVADLGAFIEKCFGTVDQ